ncbi:hypothetical protein GBA52_008215 [Prunus armeniaca]|nr:hypothetical protein GBA52_008215 [Prunus armeniaca]
MYTISKSTRRRSKSIPGLMSTVAKVVKQGDGKSPTLLAFSSSCCHLEGLGWLRSGPDGIASLGRSFFDWSHLEP